MRDRPSLAAVLAVLALAACGDEAPGPLFPAPPEASGPAVAYGIWTPAPGECAAELHDAHSVIGPDGKLYPTWHPPEDPSGCSFGHEHGRDPRGSDLHAVVGDIPFGLANEALEAWDPANPRREDHVGHKIEWENDVAMELEDGVASATFRVRCDVLTKLHQGTHSKDAFTNNVHEQVYHLRCDDGTGMSLTLLTAIGEPGEFTRSCDRETVVVGPATPANSPSGGGIRLIPDRTCVERHLFVAGGEWSNYHSALHENWETSSAIRTEGGRTLAFINPYYQVRLPSRYHDPAVEGIVRRPVDACRETLPDGRGVRGGPCDESGASDDPGILWNDERSPFDGAGHFIDVNANIVKNADGPERWYADPYGRNARTTPFAGSVPQWIARKDNQVGVLQGGPVVGSQRAYAGAGTHAPN